MSRNIPFRNFYPKFMNSHFCLTICMNFFTFISHLVSLQSKQPLFFPGVYSRVGVAQCSSSSGTISQRSYAFPRCDTCGRQHPGDCRCNIPHSGIKTIISCQPKNRVINIYIYIYIFMVFVLKSIKNLTESPLYLKVPSYLHVTCLHF
jgi:hypothetical protein